MSKAKQQSIQTLLQHGAKLVQEGNGFIQMARLLCPHVETKIVHVPIENGNVTMIKNHCVDCGAPVEP